MTWLLYPLIALYTAVAGFFCGIFVGTQCARWFRITSAEGASGYYAALFGIVGAVAGLIVGAIIAAAVAPQNGSSALKAAGVATLVAVILSAAILGVSRLIADVPPRIDARPLIVEAELRLPPGASYPLDEAAAWSIELHQVQANRSQTWQYGEIDRQQTREVDGRWLVLVRAPLFTARGSRLLRVSQGHDGKDLAKIPLPIAGKPGRDAFTWSAWQDHVPEVGAQPLAYRFRVQLQAPPPAPPSREQVLEETNRRAEAAFDAIPSDAPLSVWLPYTRTATLDSLREKAIARICARPDLLQELGPLMSAADPETATDALRFVTHLPAPSAAWIEPVTAAGHDLAVRLRKVNATPEAEDPSYEGAADVCVRFVAWMQAVRTLRAKAGADFTPELRTLLELSRVRTESVALRMDVRRVASFYLHEWAGVPPHPEDPPPR